MLNNNILRNQLTSRRTFIIGAGKLSLLSILISKLFYMQLIKQGDYLTLSNKNRISIMVIAPERGQIYDTNGKLLATNKLCFKLLLDKQIRNYIDELKLLQSILVLDEQQFEEVVHKVSKADSRVPVMILDQLNWQQISIIEEYKSKFNAIFTDVGQIRFYPASDIAAHCIGYTGYNAEKSSQLNGNNYVFSTGKTGIEKYYNTNLQGECGYVQVEVNAFGKHIRQLANQDSVAGQDLTTNIDIDLQARITTYLSQYSSSVIVMNCWNGKLLACSSAPSFEPNNFVKLSKQYWQSLLQSPHQPLINRAVQNHYPPGSVFKLITLLAALEMGVSPEKIVYCSGNPVLGNSFRCHKQHGAVDMLSAIMYSCNSYVYEIASTIGPIPIINMAKRFGFAQLTDIDLPGEVTGFVPSPQWKKDKINAKWTIGDTLNLSIGQGFLLVTPIQLARFAAAIANDGTLLNPRLISDSKNSIKVNIKQEHLRLIKTAMYRVVNAPGGTAYNGRIFENKNMLAGKTGTAQVRAKLHAKDDLSRTSLAWQQRNHAIFIGFAPYVNPIYAIAVYIDHAGSGGLKAAPIASKVMYDVLQKYS